MTSRLVCVIYWWIACRILIRESAACMDWCGGTQTHLLWSFRLHQDDGENSSEEPRQKIRRKKISSFIFIEKTVHYNSIYFYFLFIKTLLTLHLWRKSFTFVFVSLMFKILHLFVYLFDLILFWWCISAFRGRTCQGWQSFEINAKN